MEINNIVIECLNEEHGKEILKFFSGLGVNTYAMSGDNTLENNESYRFYGVINDEFYCYPIDKVISAKATIIPTGHFVPREMMVWDNSFMGKNERKVIGKYEGRYITVPHSTDIDNYNKLFLMDNAEEIQPKIKITRKEFEKKV